jgi:NAD(P)-dependent dehydrogenase (short-subunit alcohol dehydrogenase family)
LWVLIFNSGRVEWTVLLLRVRNDAEDTVADRNNAKIKAIVSVFTGPCHIFYEKAPDLAHTVHYADLTGISEMKRVAAEVASQEPRIDVLINNAGAMFANRGLTKDGLERTFALNHMACISTFLSPISAYWII